MQSASQTVDESIAFLSRFLAGERGFTALDVAAGISRLRELHRRDPNSGDWQLAMRTARRCCEMLGEKGNDYKWACGD